MDKRSAYVNKLQSELRMVFPQYLKIFSKITTNTALTLLERYISPDAFLSAANDAKTFGHCIRSNFKRIRLYISFIRKYDEEISLLLSDIHEIVDANEATDFEKQIYLIESFKGAGFLSAVHLMGEIGDFSAFNSPKQLFAYFGLDPFEIITPEEHQKNYLKAKCDFVA